MTFYVSTAFTQVFRINNFTLSDLTTPKAFWMFEFANGDKIKPNTTDLEQDGDDILITFIIPKTTFTTARLGDCIHHVFVIDDSDDQPALCSNKIVDKVLEPIYEVNDL